MHLYSPPNVGLLKFLCSPIPLEAEGNVQPSLFVQKKLPDTFTRVTAPRKGGQFYICWLPSFLTAPHGIAVLGWQAPGMRYSRACALCTTWTHWPELISDALQLFRHESLIKTHEKLGLIL